MHLLDDRQLAKLPVCPTQPLPGGIPFPCERSFTSVWEFRSIFGFNEWAIFLFFYVISFLLVFAIISLLRHFRSKKAQP
jgi:hypothetical protein